MPAIAALSKLSMHSYRCGYRAHGALLQVGIPICLMTD